MAERGIGWRRVQIGIISRRLILSLPKGILLTEALKVDIFLRLKKWSVPLVILDLSQRIRIDRMIPEAKSFERSSRTASICYQARYQAP